jgi:hypothetical protein
MSRARDDRTPGDPIEEYLDQLRSGLRVRPEELELILAEAEDHLRETTTAGMAIGMTEREAQEAAISSFGSISAVIRAYRARRSKAAAVLGDASMAAWKLTSLLLVTCGLSGLAAVAVAGVHRQVLGYGAACSGAINCKRLGDAFAIPGSLVVYKVPGQQIVFSPDFRWLVWAAAAAIGAILLTGYCLARQRQQRLGRPREPLAEFFPVAAAGFFCAIVLALIGLKASGTKVAFAPGPVALTCLALTLGYAARTYWTLIRQPRGYVDAFGRIPRKG